MIPAILAESAALAEGAAVAVGAVAFGSSANSVANFLTTTKNNPHTAGGGDYLV